MGTAAKITIDFDAKVAALQQGIGSVRGAVNNMASNMSGSVAAGLAKFHIALGAAKAGINAITSAIGTLRESMAQMDEMEKLADRVGATADTLEVLQFAAEQTGSSWSSVSRAVQDLTKNIAMAEQGAALQAKALEDLGLDATSLKAMDLNTQLGVLADALANTTNKSERMQIAQALFGRAGREMLNMLSEGSAGLNRYASEAGSLGLLMGDARDGIEDANDAINRMKRAWGALVNQVAVFVAPALEAISNVIAKLVAGFRKLFGNNAEPPTFAALKETAGAALTATKAELKAAEETRKKAEAEAQKAAQAMADRGKSIAESLRTPMEIYRDSMTELKELMEGGHLSLEMFRRGAAQARDALEKANGLAEAVATPQIGVATRREGAFSAYQAAKRARDDDERRHKEAIAHYEAIEEAIRDTGITIESRRI